MSATDESKFNLKNLAIDTTKIERKIILAPGKKYAAESSGIKSCYGYGSKGSWSKFEVTEIYYHKKLLTTVFKYKSHDNGCLVETKKGFYVVFYNHKSTFEFSCIGDAFTFLEMLIDNPQIGELVVNVTRNIKAIDALEEKA